MELKFLLFFPLILLSQCAEQKNEELNARAVPPYFNELFGDGTFEKESSKLVQKHISSSTEDLVILFEAERKLSHLITELKSSTCDNNNSTASRQLLLSLDYHPNSEALVAEDYVSHPVNAYHLMKRTSTWIPQLTHQINSIRQRGESSNVTEEISNLISNFVLPEKEDFIFGASYGLVTLQDFHDFDIHKIAKGILVDKLTGKEYKSNSKLSSHDLLTIGSIAKNVYFLDRYVSWCEAALVVAKEEGKSSAYISKIRKIIAAGKKHHDEEIIENGFYHYIDKEDPKTLVRTNLETYDKRLMNFKDYKTKRQLRDATTYECIHFNNLIKPPIKWKFHGKIGQKIAYHLLPRTRDLCNGLRVRPDELDKGSKCFYVDHKHPYLKLGPFKYELIHKDPEMGIFHDLLSHKEMEEIKTKSRGQMRSTPYIVSNRNEEQYTRFRTSKVLYLSEHREEIARKMSDRIQLATRFKLYGEQFAAENYQAMNYGIGGTISGHVDSLGSMPGSSEEFGGPRIITFMVYLTDVPLGGHTVFPQAGISVKPVAGSALYWFNFDALEENDSRTYHLGCPVGVGNKWIANKWIKWTSQMWTYPCTTKKQQFSIHLTNR